MTKEERRLKFLKEHPNFTYERVFIHKLNLKPIPIDELGRPSKLVCRQQTKQLIDRGLIKLNKKCECGNEGMEVHHNDYFNPWDVTMTCKQCHKFLDFQRIRRENKRTVVS